VRNEWACVDIPSNKTNSAWINLSDPGFAPQPNETFNADANIGHRFAILMANVGALRPCRASGAG
jgi:hypothetical protein